MKFGVFMKKTQRFLYRATARNGSIIVERGRYDSSGHTIYTEIPVHEVACGVKEIVDERNGWRKVQCL